MRRSDAKGTGMDGFKGTANYITSKALRDVVNAAIVLGRPLLVKGEPGTGKTRLANAIADDLGMRLIIWNIKSTTKAKDGLYITTPSSACTTAVSATTTFPTSSTISGPASSASRSPAMKRWCSS